MNLYHDKNALPKFTLGRKEKENRVCELIKEGKTVREIAPIVHLNFSQIKKIREKYFSVDDEESRPPSKRSQALRLIREGKSDVDIAIELDLSAKETLEFRQEYLILNEDDDLLEFYRTVGTDKSSLLTLRKEMNIEGISAEEAVWSLSENRTYKNMTQEYEYLIKKLRPLREEVEYMEKKKLALTDQEQRLEEIRDVFRGAAENLMEETDTSMIDDDWAKRVHRRRRI